MAANDDTLKVSRDSPPPPPLPTLKPNSMLHACTKDRSTSKRPAENNEFRHDSKRANKKGTDAAAVADTMPCLIAGLIKFGYDENMLKRDIRLIGESKREKLEGRWKELEDAESELSVKRTVLFADQVLLILGAVTSTDAASNPHAATCYAELLEFEPRFGILSEDLFKEALENIGVPEWEELQQNWKDLELAEFKLGMKRSKLIAYSFKLILKAVSKSF